MADIFDYLFWRGDLTLAQSPFNAVDNIILTHLSYLPFDGIVPGPEEKSAITVAEAAERFAQARLANSPGTEPIFKEDPLLLEKIKDCDRYRNMKLAGFINQIDISQEKQFAALSIITGDESSFITYRGTDDTLVGWKEDFNMCFSDTIPAQKDAVIYLEKMSKQFKGPLRIGGHSKGGNLAVYAAAFCVANIRRRIFEIYSNDAPGFHESVIESKGYQIIREKIRSYVPQSSVVGMLLKHEDDYTVVKSNELGLLQHDIYSWEVTGNDVVRLDTVTLGSQFIDRTLKEWLSKVDVENRQRFIDTLYNILASTKARSIPELAESRFKTAGTILQTYKDIDDPTRKMISNTLSLLLDSARNNINTFLSRKDS
ncbi:MAG: DUF2974 domain-containing protein [Treponema sp.]|jgi:hypothetical protein|nr:DUF2974 domain-containing protein [Treponema sp.]